MSVFTGASEHMPPRSLPLARALRLMVDPVYGIANQLVELGASLEAPDVFVMCADGGPPSYLTDHRPTAWFNSSNASGAAYDREQALWATLGELAERYCASIYERNQFRRCKGPALYGKAIPIMDMILYSHAQYQSEGFPFKRFACDVETDWVAGIDIAFGREVYAPAQLLYLSYEWADQSLTQTVSTGLACHKSKDMACLSALLELIERDGFAASWLMGRPLSRLHLSDVDRLRLSPQTLKALEETMLGVSLYAIPNEFGIANIVAVAEHQHFGFGVFGAAANMCPYKAIEKAVLESLHGWIGFSQVSRMQGGLKHDEINTPHDHARYYMCADHWRELGWFLSGGAALNITDLQSGPSVRTLDELVGRLRMFGFEPYLFDLTTEDIRALGLCVVRALIPGLQPLCFGKAPIGEDRRRLEACAAFWNWQMPEILTTQPHPFP